MRSGERGRSISPCTRFPPVATGRFGGQVRSLGVPGELRAGPWVEERAQATVEAAFLLPVFLMVLLLSLQPACVLYTRAVMESAAAETARLLVTTKEEAQEGVRAFAMRRLAAVPDISIFHAGGPLAWDVRLASSGEPDWTVSVSIEGAVTPLPVIGAFARAFGATNAQGDIEVSVTAGYEGRAKWLEGSYETWTARWD